MNKYFQIILCLLCVHAPYAHSQYISTIAGNGTMGFTGDGGPAVLAELYLPNGLAIDSTGNVYVATSDNRVRKISTTGIITTIAGNGSSIYAGDGVPATATGIGNIQDIKFDQNWNLYMAATTYPRILKVNTAGIITTVAGTGTVGFSGDGGQATAANLQGNDFFAIDTAGNIYLSDRITSRIRKVNTAGIITTIAGTGVPGYSGDGGPASAAQLNTPGPGWVDRHGNLYITDELNYRVRKIDVSGIITTIAGTGVAGYSGDGGPATAAQIRNCRDIAMDTAGNIYVCDGTVYVNNCIRKISPSGIITTIVGGPTHYSYGGDGGPATAALVAGPLFFARRNDGPIYFSDRENNRVRMISNAPYFLHGKYQLVNVCMGGVLSLDTLLAASDSTAGLTEHWSLISGPHHGAASVAYTATTTGNVIYPAGLTYTPTTGFTGLDTFMVQVTDSIISDTTTIYVNVVPHPNAGVITGVDTLCISDAGFITLTDTAAGGSWFAINTLATVTAGIVRGYTAGFDTILYVTSNACGADTASHVVQVKACRTSVPITTAQNKLAISPNPSRGTFTFMLTASYQEDVHITITNLEGEQVNEITTTTNNATEIILRVPAGVYLMRATTVHGAWNNEIVVTK